MNQRKSLGKTEEITIGNHSIEAGIKKKKIDTRLKFVFNGNRMAAFFALTGFVKS